MSLPEKHPDVADVSDALWEAALELAHPDFRTLYRAREFHSAIHHARCLILLGEVEEPVDPTDAAIDDSRNNAGFDIQAWLSEGRANAAKLPVGVVLPEPTDWADEVISQFRKSRGITLTDFIRTHCQPREVSNG